MPVTSKNKNIDYNDEDGRSSSNFVPLKKENKKINWEYNDKSQKSFRKNGLQVPDNLDYQERNFLSKVSVDPKKGHEIRREITKIVRIKARDYSSPRLERKEFLYYYENWYGVNWTGNKIAPVTDHVEGIYQEIEMEEVIGHQNEVIGKKRSGVHTVYYIPFSKSKVDEIIESSIGTDRDTIIFTFVDGALSYEFPYEEFVNRSYDELASMLIAPGGPKSILQKQQLESWQKEQEQISATLAKATKQVKQ